jgi:hypothetical protein
MRRQTILLAAALAVTTPSAALTESRSVARQAALATQHKESPAPPDRLILRIEDAKTASPSVAPVAEAALLAQLAEAHKSRHAAMSAAAQRFDTRTNARARSQGDATAAEPSADSAARETGFAAHHGLSPEQEFPEDRERVSLKLAPVTVQSRRDGDWETLRLDDTVDGGDVAGVAVGLSFKLN